MTRVALCRVWYEFCCDFKNRSVEEQMKLRGFLIGFAGVLFSAYCFAGVKRFGVIEGKVTVNGAPVKGARVSTGEGLYFSRTNARGEYQLKLRPNVYTLRATYHGYQPVVIRDVQVLRYRAKKKNGRVPRRVTTVNFDLTTPLVFNEKTYVGSYRCMPCHEAIYKDWRKSRHSKFSRTPMTKPGVVSGAKQAFIQGLDLSTFPAFGGYNPAPVLSKVKKLLRDHRQYQIEGRPHIWWHRSMETALPYKGRVQSLFSPDSIQ